MLEKDTLIKVTNRDNGSLGYSVPDLNNLHRRFEAGETKEITMEELRKLSYLEGGLGIIKNYLLIHNEDAVRELIGEVEPEYYYQEAEIKDLLEKGSLEMLEDCLDFAPYGTKELLKKVATEMELNDIKKRAAIKDNTGYDIDKAIEVNKETSETFTTETKQRRVRNVTENKESAPTRRTSNYTILSIDKK